MNFVTLEHIGSLYPVEMLKNRLSYAFRTPLSPSQQSVLLRHRFVLVTESNGHPTGRQGTNLIYRFTGYLPVHLIVPEFFRTKVYPDIPSAEEKKGKPRDRHKPYAPRRGNGAVL
ncbi:uncharacterized protein LACBIDRAFT_331078 [Laccaria bicolor S238N-H82]|uniref:Predicted protein n=1 Tax=Laccaria bicolor (strain S238N-H82 / ATCC MYA-4686) TaxID=486041 RepID=B0DNE1_LACBS|nr:uncharacterized protein LACBIDRAFT_331078 [Laccaria bicolor S238N-H82]EDR03853.1 predicted protein [Laccaria bicolor S238N-H82]|eukprot:XP_001885421.1 predicted protein [Laccaria bicolor S238N-H82]